MKAARGAAAKGAALALLLAAGAQSRAAAPLHWRLAQGAAWWAAHPPAPWAASAQPLGLTAPRSGAGSCLSLDRFRGVEFFLDGVLDGVDSHRELARRGASSEQLARVRWLTVRRAMPEVADYFDDELQRAEAAVEDGMRACAASLETPLDPAGLWRQEAVREAWRGSARAGADPIRARSRAEQERTRAGAAAGRDYARLGTLDALVSLGWRNLSLDLRGFGALFADQASLRAWLREVVGGTSGERLPGYRQAGMGLLPDWERTRQRAEAALVQQWRRHRASGRADAAVLESWELAPGFLAPLARQEEGTAMAALGLVARELATLRVGRKALLARRVLLAALHRGEVQGHPMARSQAREVLRLLDSEWQGLVAWAQAESAARSRMQAHLQRLPLPQVPGRGG